MSVAELFTAEELATIKHVYSFSNSNIVSSTTFAYDFFERLKKNKRATEYFKREFSGKRIIELGPGFFGCGVGYNAKNFQELGVAEYIAVEPLLAGEVRFEEKFDIPVTIVAVDALSYLYEQPDESAIVFSGAVFREDAMLDVGLPVELQVKYLEHVCRNIARITPAGSIGLHVGHFFACHEQFGSLGFALEIYNGYLNAKQGGDSEEEMLINELKNSIGFGGHIYRKTAKFDLAHRSPNQREA